MIEKSQSRLEYRDLNKILDLVSRPEILWKKFSISSRGTRLKEAKSRSCLESQKRHLATLWGRSDGFHTSIHFFQTSFKHPSTTLKHPFKHPSNTLQNVFIRGGRGGGGKFPFCEVTLQKIVYFTSDGFPNLWEFILSTHKKKQMIEYRQFRAFFVENIWKSGGVGVLQLGAAGWWRLIHISTRNEKSQEANGGKACCCLLNVFPT